MSSLLGRSPKDSFSELLKLDNTGAGLDSTLRALQDGTGVNSPLLLSTSNISLNGSVWPVSGPSSGQVLTAGSSGSLSWATPAKVLQSINSFFVGTIIPTVGATRWYPRSAITVVAITIFINTPPTQLLTVDLKRNGSSILTTKPTIAVGSNQSTAVTLNVAISATDYLTCDILTGNGSDLTVRIDYN